MARLIGLYLLLGCTGMLIPRCEAQYSCNFDDGTICQLINEQGEYTADGSEYDWQIVTGSTASDGTGPQTGYGGSAYYVYAEGSAPRVQGDSANLLTPVINYNGAICVSYAYHMYGDLMGSLTLYRLNNGVFYNIHDVRDNQGDTWQLRQETISIQAGDQIGWRAIRGGDYRSDIAMDQIQISLQSCTAEGGSQDGSVSLPFMCDFEDISICSMQQRSDEQFDWSRNQGPTDTLNTGPNSAYSGNYYMYVDVSGGVQGDRATLETPMISISGNSMEACVGFYYHMLGEDIGALYINTASRSLEAWYTRYVDVNTDQWYFAQVDVTLMQNDKVQIIGQRGNGIRGDIAVDMIMVTAGRCSSPLPFSCDFEDPTMCNMMQRFDDNFDWTRQQGQTPTMLTGPTSAYSSEYYMYIESSDPRQQGDRAIIETPALQLTTSNSPACVEFYYHMRGNDIGSLEVSTTTRSQSEPYMTFSNINADQWNMGQVDVVLNQNDRVQFVGVRGRDYQGDIAIDMVSVRSGQCQGGSEVITTLPTTTTTTTTTTTAPPSGNSLPYTCSFENSICGMTQRPDDQFDWTRKQGSTETGDTGPDMAVSGAVYLYAEGSSPRAPRDRAQIDTPGLAYQGPMCVHFRYHMYGADMGELRVSISGRQVIWEMTGNRGNSWQTADVTTSILQGDTVQFIAERGSSYRSDIGIDDIVLTAGGCAVDPPPVDPTQPPVQPDESTYYTCDFEGDGASDTVCRLRQDTQDNFDFTRISGRTPSGLLYERRINEVRYPVTGPENAYQGLFYGYIEASGRPSGQSAGLILEGSLFNVQGQNCLKFWYNMNGFHIGELHVFMDNGAGRKNVWSLAGDQLQGWHNVALDLNFDNDRELGMTAITKGEFSGDISLDDIQLTSGSCTSTPSQYLWKCTFETQAGGAATLCNVQQEDFQDQFDWTLAMGPTPSRVTGPTQAYSPDWYIYIESSFRNRGDFAKILLPTINYNGRVCVEFWRHMYGFHTDELEIFTRLAGVDTEVWNIMGQQGNFWSQERVTVDHFIVNGQIPQIGFKGVRGDAFSGDIALDDIGILPNACL